MEKTNRGLLLALSIILVVFVAGCAKKADFDNLTESETKITVFKSLTCGCCVGWAEYAKNSGLDVDLNIVDDIDSVKDEYNIPNNLRSCHTSIIGEYFVEGHMPLEAVKKLLDEKPDIDGIALPGMPSGSAGMPGPKRETWIIYSIKDGKAEEFMRI